MLRLSSFCMVLPCLFCSDADMRLLLLRLLVRCLAGAVAQGAVQRMDDLVCQRRKPRRKRLPPRNEHQINAHQIERCLCRVRKPCCRHLGGGPQAAADAVALHGRSGLAARGQAKPEACRLPACSLPCPSPVPRMRICAVKASLRKRRPFAAAALKSRLSRMWARPIASTLLAGPAAGSETRLRARGRAYALRRLRPWARRAAMTLRPPLVAMRARKPWRRLRTSLLG